MKIFISWSGEKSKLFAKEINDLITRIIPQVKPWMSTNEIRKGDTWNQKLIDSLRKSKYGLICLTNLNQYSPWILFETGSIATSLKKSKVCPLLIDFSVSDLISPYNQYQATNSTKEDLLNLFLELNYASDQKRETSIVEEEFELHWKKFHVKMMEILEIEEKTNNLRSQNYELKAKLDSSKKELDEFKNKFQENVDSEIVYYPDVQTIAKCLSTSNYVQLFLAGGDTFYVVLKQALDSEQFKSNRHNELKIEVLLRRSSLASKDSYNRYMKLGETNDLEIEVRWYDGDFMLRGYCFDMKYGFFSYFLRDDDELTGVVNKFIKIRSIHDKTEMFIFKMYQGTFRSFFNQQSAIDPDQTPNPIIEHPGNSQNNE